MGIQTAAVLYPVNSTVVDSGGGVDIRLLDSAQAGGDDDTQTATATHTQDNGGRVFDPASGAVVKNVGSSATVGYALRQVEDASPSTRHTLDASGNDRHGLITGAPVLIASPFSGYGSALQFDGLAAGANSDGVTLGTSQDFALRGNSVFCLDFKFRPTLFQGFKFLLMRDGAGGFDWAIFIGGNDGANMEVRFLFRDTTGADISVNSPSSHFFPNNSNNNIRVTYDGATVSMFVNDLVTPCTTYSATQPHATPVSVNTYVGRGTDASPATVAGIIDEVRFSDVVRTDDMSAPYTADANTLGLWHLDDVTCRAVLTTGTLTVNLQVAVNQSGGTYAGPSYSPRWDVALWDYDPVANTGTLIESVAFNFATSWVVGGLGSEMGVFKNIALPIAIDPLYEFPAGHIPVLEIGLNTQTIPNPTLGTATFTYTLRVDTANTNITFAAGQGFAALCRMTASISGNSSFSANSATVLPGAVSVSGAGAAAFGGMAFAEAAFTAAGAGALAANATAFAHASFVSEGEAEFSADGAEVIGAEFSIDVGGGGGTVVRKVVIYEKG